VVHPFVIGELACGALRRRAEILDLLLLLPASTIASDAETLRFIELHRLMGKGIGYIDAHLLASVILTESASLWTHDKRLGSIAGQLRIGYES